MQWQNTVADICTGDKNFCKRLKHFFEIQLNWTYAQIDTNPNDEYWHQVYTQKKKQRFLFSTNLDCLDKSTSCSIKWSY
jgi:hypothetical protein